MEYATKTAFRLEKRLYFVELLLLCSGIALSAIAAMHLCSEACAAGHKYKLYGFAFESIGIAFFSTATLLFAFSIKYSILRLFVAALFFGALGAEVMFTYAQKYIIGHWCPICLSIASTVLLACVLFTVGYFHNLKMAILHNQKGKMMKGFFKGLGAVLLMTVGFVFSQAGFAKFDQLQAIEKEIVTNIALGKTDSSFEVYVFTDWKCPACRKIEPIIEQSAPKVMEKAKLIFVDFPIHEESLNFTPYNLSFLINNKAEYFKLRKGLGEISENTDAPTTEQIQTMAKALGVTYKQLNYADIATGINYYKDLVKEFEVTKTPTVIIVNTSNRKGKKLSGSNEISQKNILDAIESLGKP